MNSNLIIYTSLITFLEWRCAGSWWRFMEVRKNSPQIDARRVAAPAGVQLESRPSAPLVAPGAPATMPVLIDPLHQLSIEDADHIWGRLLAFAARVESFLLLVIITK